MSLLGHEGPKALRAHWGSSRVLLDSCLRRALQCTPALGETLWVLADVPMPPGLPSGTSNSKACHQGSQGRLCRGSCLKGVCFVKKGSMGIAEMGKRN